MADARVDGEGKPALLSSAASTVAALGDLTIDEGQLSTTCPCYVLA